MKWINSPKITPEEKVGFVYQITELSTNKKYIGIKKFWKTTKYKPVKRKTKKHTIKESDWREYNSSSKELQAKILLNPNDYKKEILKLCDTITEMKIHEAYIQLDYYISGNWNQLYNEMINLRVRIRK